MSNQEFIEFLVRKQVMYALTDREMAEKLHCSRQLWQQTRTGNIPIGLTILRGSVKEFPETKDKVIYALAQDNLSLQRTTVRDITDTPKQCYSGILRQVKQILEDLYSDIKNLFS